MGSLTHQAPLIKLYLQAYGLLPTGFLPSGFMKLKAHRLFSKSTPNADVLWGMFGLKCWKASVRISGSEVLCIISIKWVVHEKV